jgi:hypothetical protein
MPPNPSGPTRSTEGDESIEKIPTRFREVDTGDHADVRGRDDVSVLRAIHGDHGCARGEGNEGHG